MLTVTVGAKIIIIILTSLAQIYHKFDVESIILVLSVLTSWMNLNSFIKYIIFEKLDKS